MGRKGGVIHVISINGLLPPTAIHDLGITTSGDIGPRARVQQGGQDCGLFAIAFMYALCTGKDPHLCSFDQLQMRCHLHSCLQSQTMSEFPAATKPRRLGRTRVKSVRCFNVYCTCRLIWNKNQNIFGDLAKCGRCKEWFHQRCQNIPDEVYIEPSYNWLCSSCSIKYAL